MIPLSRLQLNARELDLNDSAFVHDMRGSRGSQSIARGLE